MRRIACDDDIAEGLEALAKADPRLNRVIAAAGPVPLRRSPAGFASLASIIVSQQVSKAAADAIHGRPLYCLSPLVLDWIGRPAQDRYLSYVDDNCRKAEDPMIRPAEAVIQNQLFMKDPL